MILVQTCRVVLWETTGLSGLPHCTGRRVSTTVLWECVCTAKALTFVPTVSHCNCAIIPTSSRATSEGYQTCQSWCHQAGLWGKNDRRWEHQKQHRELHSHCIRILLNIQLKCTGGRRKRTAAAALAFPVTRSLPLDCGEITTQLESIYRITYLHKKPAQRVK